MKKNKFNINPAPLSEEDIQKGQNFEAFHKQYQQSQRGSILRRLALPALAVAAMVTIAIFVFRQPDGGQQMMAQFINPPIQGLERVYDNFAFVVEEGLQLTLPSGTVISIPANAFVGLDGKPFKGEAVLKYREYTDPVAIALSGIPMTYDSAGAKYTFESAGMFDIAVEGKPNDSATPQPLSLANGTVVSVGLTTSQPDEAFNVYELDTVNRNWSLRGQDSIVSPVVTALSPAPTVASTPAPTKKKEEPTDPELQKLYNTLQVMNDSINYYKNLSLIKPIKSSTEGNLFHLEMKINEFPELVLNEIVSWEVAAFTDGFDRRYLSTRWDKRTVTRIEGTIYNIQLIKGADEYNFKCKPVYHGKHYQTALKYYEDKSAENTARLAQLEQLKKDKQEQYNAYKLSLTANKGQGTKQDLSAKEQEYLDQYNTASSQNTVYRYVSVSRMGIWNCDRIWKQPEYVRAETEFVDSKGEVLAMHRLILFEGKVNGSFEFFKMPDNHTVRFLYNPSASYQGLGITTSGEVFVVRANDIKGVKTEGINTITVKELFIPKSEQELKTKLGV